MGILSRAVNAKIKCAKEEEKNVINNNTAFIISIMNLSHAWEFIKSM